MGRLPWPKDLMPLVRAAQEAGWEVIRAEGTSHIKFRPPAGSPYPQYTTSGTPSDWRAIKNARAFLRRCGVVEKGRR